MHVCIKHLFSLFVHTVEVATVVLNRCITDNKSKDCTEKDDDYTVTYNYEFLEDYQEKEKDELIGGWWDDDEDSIDTHRRGDDDDIEYVVTSTLHMYPLVDSVITIIC